jgi:hypothetical protein
MLAKEPADRPQTPTEVAEEMAPFAHAASSGAVTAGPAAPTVTRIRSATFKASESSGPSRWKAMRWKVIWGIASAVCLGLWLWLAGVFRSPPSEGTLVLTVSDSGAEVVLDGDRVATVGDDEEPIEVRRPPGKYRLEIRKPGFTSEQREVTLGPGGRTELTVDLELAVEPPQPGAASPDALFQKGTIWSGRQVKHVPNQKDPVAPVTLVVTERSGDTFRARYKVGNNEFRLKGTVKDGAILWHADDVQVESLKPKGNPPNVWDHSGRINGETMALRYQTSPRGKSKGHIAATIVLTLVKP